MSSAVRALLIQLSSFALNSAAQLVSILRHSATARSCRSCSTVSAACSGVRSPLQVLLNATATTGWSGSARPSTITPSSSWLSAPSGPVATASVSRALRLAERSRVRPSSPN